MTSSDDIPPLERIRQVERDIARQIHAAQADAEDRKLAARRQATALKQEAADSGRALGERDYRAAISVAEQEAQQIVDEARQRANNLLHNREAFIQAMVDEVMEIILGRGKP